MKTHFKLIIAITIFTYANTTYASNINVTTGFSAAGPQVSAADYKSIVEAAVATSSVGYGNAAVDLYDNISNHRLFGGPSQNIAFESTIDFNVTAASAGEWGFRFGVDFGRGGAVFLNGAARAFSSNDMWWGYSYSNPSQYFEFNAILNAGDHQLKVYGLENCCDGGQQTQFRIPGEASYVTFGSPVPEPEIYAMLLAGLGLIGFMSRRRKTA